MDKKIKKNFKIRILDIVIYVFPVIIAVFIIKNFIGYTKIFGPSMYPTLKNGQHIVVNTRDRNYQKGDIVTFYSKTKYISEVYVKRIVATAGDVVQIIDGRLYINNEPESKYDDGFMYIYYIEDAGLLDKPYTVPENTVFTLGDNRNFSDDSRVFGAININKIIGKTKK